MNKLEKAVMQRSLNMLQISTTPLTKDRQERLRVIEAVEETITKASTLLDHQQVCPSIPPFIESMHSYQTSWTHLEAQQIEDYGRRCFLAGRQGVPTVSPSGHPTTSDDTMQQEFVMWHDQRADRLMGQIKIRTAEYIADGFSDSAATRRSAMFDVLKKCDETGWEAWQAACSATNKKLKV